MMLEADKGGGLSMIDPKSLRLVEIIQKLSLCQTLDEIIHIVRKAAREISGADGATFVLKEEDLCHYVDEDALGPLFKGNHFPANICISGAAMAEGRAIVVPDIYEDARIPIDVYRPTFVRSLCMTPIREKNPVGAIGAYWKDPHVATEDEALMLAVLANASSIAMENVYLQTQLKARLEQVNRLNRLKDEFLRNLSHELRTPLNQILGWVQLLSEGADEAELAEGLAAMEKSGRRQESIVKDLLDCSALISGEMEFDAMNFDLGDLIAPLIESFRPAINGKRLSVEVVSETTGGLIHADRMRCREILWHLVSNAVKFSKTGGQITIACYRDDSDCMIEVKDSGIGVEREFLPRVFDLFAQVDSGITRTYAGTGLGLSISRYLAEAQGGAVLFDSQGLDRGATATLKFPTAAIRFVRKRNADSVYMEGVFDHLFKPVVLVK